MKKKLTAGLIACIATVAVPAGTEAKSKKMTRAGAELAVAEKVERVYRKTVDGGLATATCRRITSRYYDCEYEIDAGDAFENGYTGRDERYGGTGSVRKPKGSSRWVVRVSRPR